MRLFLIIALLVIGLGAVVGGQLWSSAAAREARTPFNTAPVRIEDFSRAVTASGSLQPTKLVEVGSAAAGRIAELGVDAEGKPLTLSSRVEKGTVLAKLDDSAAQLTVREAQAALNQANVARERAEFQQSVAKSKLEKAQGANPGTLSVMELETVQNAARLADLDAKAAAGMVEKAQIALDEAKAALAQMTIVAPIAGEILDLRAKVGQVIGGQTLGATLFVLVSNLHELQVWATINEVDIGSIAVGQRAKFTVEAYPDSVFTGKVLAVWPNASLVSDVVSYPVIVSVEGDAGILKPYLTANVQIVVEERPKSILVAATALEWTPETAQIDPAVLDAYEAAVNQPLTDGKKGFLWTPNTRGKVEFVEVRVGPTDGVQTVVSPVDPTVKLEPNQQVVVSVRERAARRESGGALPFVGKKKAGADE